MVLLSQQKIKFSFKTISCYALFINMSIVVLEFSLYSFNWFGRVELTYLILPLLQKFYCIGDEKKMSRYEWYKGCMPDKLLSFMLQAVPFLSQVARRPEDQKIEAGSACWKVLASYLKLTGNWWLYILKTSYLFEENIPCRQTD